MKHRRLLPYGTLNNSTQRWRGATFQTKKGNIYFQAIFSLISKALPWRGMLSYHSRFKLFAFPSPSLDSKILGFQLPRCFECPNFSDFLIFHRCLTRLISLLEINLSLQLQLLYTKCVSWAIVIIFSTPEPKAHWSSYRISRPPSCVICPSVVHTLYTSCPQKPQGQSKSNFIWSLHGMGERKFVETVHVTWPKWPPCPYMEKTLKNPFLRNQKANDLETWYAAWGVRVLPFLFKLWRWVDLDLFYGKVKYGPVCFCMGNR